MGLLAPKPLKPEIPTERHRLWHFYWCQFTEGRPPIRGDKALCGHEFTGIGAGRDVDLVDPDSCVVCTDMYLALR